MWKYIFILASVPFFTWCSSPEPQKGTGEYTVRNTSSDICSLSESGDSFTCDMVYSLDVCSRGPRQAEKSEFVKIMTKIILEMLYLENEAGASPPYHYTNAAQVLNAVKTEKCMESDGNCKCRMMYSDPHLKEIFYDSAGCRYGSEYKSNPLYFRGRGCRS